jgi:putative transposase
LKRLLSWSDSSFYGSLQPSEARELKQLRDDVTKLKRLVADLSLDKVMLQDVIQKKF